MHSPSMHSTWHSSPSAVSPTTIQLLAPAASTLSSLFSSLPAAFEKSEQTSPPSFSSFDSSKHAAAYVSLRDALNQLEHALNEQGRAVSHMENKIKKKFVNLMSAMLADLAPADRPISGSGTMTSPLKQEMSRRSDVSPNSTSRDKKAVAFSSGTPRFNKEALKSGPSATSYAPKFDAVKPKVKGGPDLGKVSRRVTSFVDPAAVVLTRKYSQL
eukprot:GILI01020828.1.p1 GENE.GILI01020828.1~~GILI01020828.1.p1  ORF type:complete len:214 (+),score=56.97 GILI01020828.1:1-642(+)